MVLLHPAQADDRAHRLGVVAVGLGLGIDVLDVVGGALLLFLQPLDALDEQALVNILTEPKNALVKQYQKLLEMDGVKLTFDDDALRQIAKEALKRKTGARGLRSIIEGIMRNVMYEVPSIEGVTSCRVTKDVVTTKKDPVLTIDKKAKDGKEVSA